MECFGGKDGALRQYVLVRESGSIVLKPPNMTFEQAAAVPVAAVTALQGFRDSGKWRRAEGVDQWGLRAAWESPCSWRSTSAPRLTTVCSTRNVDLVKSLGADHVVDYTHEDFAQSAQRYDVIFDTVVTAPWRTIAVS